MGGQINSFSTLIVLVEMETKQNNPNKGLVEYLSSIRVLKSKHVKNAFLRTDRALFVPQLHRNEAYRDYALPIGHGQTISQPLVLAHMLEALELKPGHRVLEIGTGSGYSTALTAHAMGEGELHSYEFLPQLQERAKQNIASMGANKPKGVSMHFFAGSPLEQNPPKKKFDRIVVHCAIPRETLGELAKHLKVGGYIVAPVGTRGLQALVRYRKKNSKGELEENPLIGVVFVHLRGKHGFDYYKHQKESRLLD